MKTSSFFYFSNAIVKVLFLCVTFFLSENLYSSECNINDYTLSKLKVELEDKEYLEMVMGFSYGPEVKKFIPDLVSLESNYYYKGSKELGVMTFLTAKYRNDKVAKKAFGHLKSKWASNKNNQYDFLLVGKKVVWFGNNRLDRDCFFKISKVEKERLSKNE